MFLCGWLSDLSTGDHRCLAGRAEAVAAKTRAAVVFAGLPDAVESEWLFDCSLTCLRAYRLIERVCAVQPNTVVVLHNGSRDRPKAVVETHLGGEAEATVDVKAR